MKARQLHAWVHNKWGVAAALVAFLAVLGLAEARPNKTAELSGLAKATGTVTSPSEFKAAKSFSAIPTGGCSIWFIRTPASFRR